MADGVGRTGVCVDGVPGACSGYVSSTSWSIGNESLA